MKRRGCPLTIEEAIEKLKEDSRQNETLYDIFADTGDTEKAEEFFRSDVEFYFQLAEWLTELKAYIEAFDEIRCLPQVWEEGQGIATCIEILELHLKGGGMNGK